MEWRAIKGFSNYEVSECGKVRRITHRYGKHGQRLTNKIPYELAQCVGGNGYINYILSNDNGKLKNIKAHRVVAETFLGLPEAEIKIQVAHNDGSKTNNHFSNLRWATAKENMADKILHKTAICGESVHTAKLTLNDVERIRAESPNIKRYGKNKYFSEKYGVSIGTIKSLLRGDTWRSLVGIFAVMIVSGCSPLGSSDSYCRLYQPIFDHARDTVKTRDQIRERNSVYECVCLKNCPQ